MQVINSKLSYALFEHYIISGLLNINYCLLTFGSTEGTGTKYKRRILSHSFRTATKVEFLRNVFCLFSITEHSGITALTERKVFFIKGYLNNHNTFK